ncbi:DUF4097 family beta strand repeat-containing protein [Curtobacterium sp. MCBD17_040]|uniref:DUF4097 family beta strand repeat-containing protein n=1 Tax=Curtobacterium sp. MCBD17_040 TaxID=2175674 RepID=UPI000DA7B9EF|nr:DUF4097 family beta strand repeat-containing protein [Curtobacterium sp. MCBD17_040]WIB64202.1 DUF4097 family beta strand repeat-containing protein [Curtobacterium sp. MCBD17_040]
MAQEKWLVDEPKVIDTGVVRQLKVGLVGGQVDVVAHDEPTARVEVHAVSGRPLRVEMDAGVLTVDHAQVRWDDPLGFLRAFRGQESADVSILVPRQVALTLGVVSAGALVSGLTHDAALHAVSGDLVVDRVSGDLQVNSVSGTVTVREHAGALAVRTVSGDVAATGAVTRLTADGISADVLLDLQGVPDGVRVSTVSGAVSLRLADGVGYACSVTTATGRLQFDDDEVRGVHGPYTRRSGTLEGRWADVRVATVSGRFALFHADPEPSAASPTAGATAGATATDDTDGTWTTDGTAGLGA